MGTTCYDRKKACRLAAGNDAIAILIKGRLLKVTVAIDHTAHALFEKPAKCRTNYRTYT
jgi:hypothetical protein